MQKMSKLGEKARQVVTVATTNKFKVNANRRPILKLKDFLKCTYD